MGSLLERGGEGRGGEGRGGEGRGGGGGRKEGRGGEGGGGERGRREVVEGWGREGERLVRFWGCSQLYSLTSAVPVSNVHILLSIV